MNTYESEYEHEHEWMNKYITITESGRGSIRRESRMEWNRHDEIP